MLNFASIKGNNNKFYQLTLTKKTDTEYVLTSEFGRVGTTAQRSEKFFCTEEDGIKNFEKILKSKIKKGYAEIELRGADASAEADSTTQDTEEVTTETFDGELGKVYAMLRNFTKDAKTHVKKNITTPLGALSDNQLERALAVLASLENALHSPTKPDDTLLYTLSDDFYRLIPIRFNSYSKSTLLIDSLEKTAKHRDLIDVMRSVVVSGVDTTMADVYSNLGFTLTPLDTEHTEHLYIKNYVENTQSNHHRFKIQVENIFKVDNPLWDAQFNPNGLETTYLFHGSRAENFLRIFQSGLKIKPSGIYHTGSMFGNGIYFADQSSKSANYTWNFSRQSTRKGEKFYMLVCDVATGAMKDYTNAQTLLTKAPQGYDSVRGVKGSSLLHNEIIVYNENQSNIKYVVEFTAS